ncbi:hypothetical protein L8C07_08105 [Paenibacillus sp. CMAA1739]|uniref:hypothetical protein n=1 Tax=Paenibacillus ottowii TaxID=2315729 RepID=UPI002DB9D19A|nr:hypothetical protein [Paenibacillus sp. CMAA1739]MEC4565907.1 hypothetical protein [Paenibacillus sp. CMAA1739]
MTTSRALYDIPAGEKWPLKRIVALRKPFVQTGFHHKIVEKRECRSLVRLVNEQASGFVTGTVILIDGDV